MRYFWNYIFYFTYLFAYALGELFVLPINFLLYKVLSVNNNQSKNADKYIIDGTAASFAYKIILCTTEIIILNFIMILTYVFNFNIIHFIEPWTGKLEETTITYSILFSALIISIAINEVFLKWDSNGYEKQFKKFKSIKNKKKGYCITVLFHTTPLALLVYFIYHFNLYRL